MINWSRLSIERKMEISNEIRAFIKNNYVKEDSVLIGASKREIFKKPNGTKTSFAIFNINDVMDHICGSFDVRVDCSNFDEIYDFCLLNPFFKSNLLKHLDKFKTKRMAIKGMLVNSKVYMFLSDKLKSDPEIFKLALRSKRGCVLKDAPKKILSSNRYFEMLASEQIDVIPFFDKKILNNPKNFPLIASKLYRVKNLSTVNCLPETLKQFYIDAFIKNFDYPSLSRKLSPKWILKNCRHNVVGYMRMCVKSGWSRDFSNDVENRYFKALINMDNTREARGAAIAHLVLQQQQYSINSFYNVVINLINHPQLNKNVTGLDGYRRLSPFEIAHQSAELKELGFNTVFADVVREALDITYELPGWDINPCISPHDLPF